MSSIELVVAAPCSLSEADLAAWWTTWALVGAGHAVAREATSRSCPRRNSNLRQQHHVNRVERHGIDRHYRRANLFITDTVSRLASLLTMVEIHLKTVQPSLAASLVDLGKVFKLALDVRLDLRGQQRERAKHALTERASNHDVPCHLLVASQLGTL